MNNFRFLPLLFFMILLNGCSAFGWLKFWDSEDEEEGPAELFSINQSIKFRLIGRNLLIMKIILED